MVGGSGIGDRGSDGRSGSSGCFDGMDRGSWRGRCDDIQKAGNAQSPATGWLGNWRAGRQAGRRAVGQPELVEGASGSSEQKSGRRHRVGAQVLLGQRRTRVCDEQG